MTMENIGQQLSGATMTKRSAVLAAVLLAGSGAAGFAQVQVGAGAGAFRAARCAALTRAASDSVDLVNEIARLSDETVEDLKNRFVEPAKEEVDSWIQQETALIRDVKGALFTANEADCIDALTGENHCAAAAQCLSEEAGDLQQVIDGFSDDSYTLGLARVELSGRGLKGHALALEAIKTEEEFRDVRKPFIQHAAHGFLSRCAGLAPEGTGFWGEIIELDRRDRDLQGGILRRVDDSWQFRFGGGGINPRGRAAFRRISRHNDALQVWMDEAPEEALKLTDYALGHSRASMSYLENPAGNFSRNLVIGSSALRGAHHALHGAALEWIGARKEACTGIQATGSVRVTPVPATNEGGPL